ncbi:hypothetical protein SRHO_G00028760 [Serrasalmus rhombeus]
MAFDLGKNEGYPTSELMSNSGLGRGKFFSEVPFTPVSRVGRADMSSPAFCSTRVLAKPIVQAPSQSLSALPDLNDPALYNLITHIAHQVGQTLMSGQQKQSREEEIDKATPVQGLGANQSITDPHSLNLSGVRLVMQSDVKEPPVFRGDESDRFTVLPVSGENPVEYWVRLNKAVDTAEEGLRRLGRQIEDPCHEVAMMFVTYCPDPALSAVFKFKAPDKWTASEIQEHLDRYQSELRQQLPAKPKRPSYMKHAAAHAECCEPDVVTASNCPVETSLRLDNAVAPVPHADDNCMTALVRLLDRALSQNNQIANRSFSLAQSPANRCKVCKSADHSTLAHCRRHRLCLNCFQQGHIKRHCPNVPADRAAQQSSPESQSLN